MSHIKRTMKAIVAILSLQKRVVEKDEWVSEKTGRRKCE
jgi:hypothetical protein